jgi:hypothetical protein
MATPQTPFQQDNLTNHSERQQTTLDQESHIAQFGFVSSYQVTLEHHNYYRMEESHIIVYT